ncbi:Uncharacterized protein TCM_045102 [Theobroma cacao]|uniref:RNase H type-1 domain-containing protein n=1 Tax=Theobroma cacao TaxID=3641 RepID=A0A061FRS2_THECC|nr:Uncharacterized protein TCM_045102 [Theobroma cacao]
MSHTTSGLQLLQVACRTFPSIYWESNVHLNWFPTLTQQCLPSSLSDHNPIALGESSFDWGPKPFKFFKHWLDDVSFQEVFKKARVNCERDGVTGDDIWQKLKPISLVSSIYKIIAKTLANRIRSVVEKVVGNCQFGFIRGRQIFDCALIANEVVDDIQKDNISGVFLKLMEEVDERLSFNCFNLYPCEWDSHQEDLFKNVGKLPSTYLGLPLGASLSSKAIWQPVLERCKAKLAGWKANILSIGGRISLIKAVLSNLPIYFMSILKMPKGVQEELDKMRRKFLWGGLGVVVGNGCTVLFWQDEWIDGVVLKDAFWEKEQWIGLLQIIGGFFLKEELHDKLIGRILLTVPILQNRFIRRWLIGKGRMEIWNMGFFAIIWSVWLSRNDVISAISRCISMRGRTLERRRSCAVNLNPINLNLTLTGIERESGRSGIGGVLRDDQGKVLIAFSKSVGMGNANFAELLAIKEALLIFVASDWVSSHELIIESDSVTAIKRVKNPEPASWRL